MKKALIIIFLTWSFQAISTAQNTTHHEPKDRSSTKLITVYMEKNLLHVFNETDSKIRKKLIEEMYTQKCVFVNFDGNIVTGTKALNKEVDKLHKKYPGNIFTISDLIEVHHETGRVLWQFGKEGAAPIFTGIHIGIIKDGKIQSLTAFISK